MVEKAGQLGDQPKKVAEEEQGASRGLHAVLSREEEEGGQIKIADGRPCPVRPEGGLLLL